MSDLLIGKDAVLILRRDQTVEVFESKALGKPEKYSRLDANIKLKVVREQEKPGNPCAIVDVQNTVSKRAAASEKESTSAALAFDDDEKEAENVALRSWCRWWVPGTPRVH